MSPLGLGTVVGRTADMLPVTTDSNTGHESEVYSQAESPRCWFSPQSAVIRSVGPLDGQALLGTQAHPRVQTQAHARIPRPILASRTLALRDQPPTNQSVSRLPSLPSISANNTIHQILTLSFFSLRCYVNAMCGAFGPHFLSRAEWPQRPLGKHYPVYCTTHGTFQLERT